MPLANNRSVRDTSIKIPTVGKVGLLDASDATLALDEHDVLDAPRGDLGDEVVGVEDQGLEHLGRGDRGLELVGVAGDAHVSDFPNKRRGGETRYMNERIGS